MENKTLPRTTLCLIVLFAGCATLSPKLEIDLQNDRLAYSVAGVGSMTVVFESGWGGGMDTWEPVFEGIASFAKTFAYDRPGYGRSSDVSGSRTGRDIVDGLRGLLAEVGSDPPYVLVGHSIGGQWVELFARLHPDEVVGVVLIDSRHPEFTERCEEALDGEGCDVPGLLRILTPGHMKRELDGAAETIEQLRAAPPFPDVELVVLSRGQGKESEAWLQLWAETQREYLTLSRRGIQIVSEGSGHYVHHDDPQMVTEAIRDVVEGWETGAGARH